MGMLFETQRGFQGIIILVGMLFETQRGFQGIISVCSVDCG